MQLLLCLYLYCRSGLALFLLVSRSRGCIGLGMSSQSLLGSRSMIGNLQQSLLVLLGGFVLLSERTVLGLELLLHLLL